MRTDTTQRPTDSRHSDETTWSAIETAAITELVDLGVSYATPGLRALMGMPVTSSCQPIVVCSRRDAAHFLRRKMRGLVDAISKPFGGSFAGTLTIIVPDAARRLVLDPGSGEPLGEERALGTLTRIADVVLTHCLAEVEGTLGLALRPDVMRRNRGFPYDVVVPVGASLEDQLFVYSLDIELGAQSIAAVFTADVERASTGALKRYLQAFLETDVGTEKETH